MPKMKSHSGTKKRFRVTGTGKLMREGFAQTDEAILSIMLAKQLESK